MKNWKESNEENQNFHARTSQLLEELMELQVYFMD